VKKHDNLRTLLKRK